jgi:hypothetical protein
MIGHRDLKLNGKVDVWDIGPAEGDPTRAAWENEYGGPVKIEFFAVDARHALKTEPNRYLMKLPKGVRAGQAQLDAEERATAENEEVEASDPHYGRKSA